MHANFYRAIKRKLTPLALFVSAGVTLVAVVTATTYLLGTTKLEAQITLPQTDQAQLPKLQNRTSSFQVIKSQVLNEQLLLTFRNEGNAAVTAFYLIVGPEGSDHEFHKVEFLFSDIRTEIGPNETYEFMIPFSKKVSAGGVLIEAILRSDGTSEGDAEAISELNDERRGQKDQLIKLLNLLDSRGFAESSYLSDLTGLKVEIASLETNKERESSAYNAGLVVGRDRLTHYLDSLIGGKDPSSYTSFLEKKSKLKAKLKRIAAKL